MNAVSLQDLRRVVGAVERLRGQEIRGVTVRSDLRHLKVELADGMILVIAIEQDEQGRPHMEVDVVDGPKNGSQQQMEVRFD